MEHNIRQNIFSILIILLSFFTLRADRVVPLPTELQYREFRFGCLTPNSLLYLENKVFDNHKKIKNQSPSQIRKDDFVIEIIELLSGLEDTLFISDFIVRRNLDLNFILNYSPSSFNKLPLDSQLYYYYEKGVLYYLQNHRHKAQFFFNKAIDISTRMSSGRDVNYFTLLGDLNFYLKRYDLAIFFYSKALSLDSTPKNKILQYLNLSRIYYELGKYSVARDFLELAKKTPGFKQNYQLAALTYSYLHKLYAKEKRYKYAYFSLLKFFEYYQKYLEQIYRIGDSGSIMTQPPIVYSKNNHRKRIDKEKQLLRILSSVFFIMLVSLLIFYIKRTNELKKNQQLLYESKKKLEAKSAQILTQLKQLERKDIKLKTILKELNTNRKVLHNKEQELQTILDELNEGLDYAHDLQKAMLPTSDLLVAYFTEHFLLYKARYKVSGDFYWWTAKDQEIIVVVADCTGHGVPGAFMSVLGISLLKEIVNNRNILRTDIIINELRSNIIEMLRQRGSQGELKDGMDLSIIRYNKNSKQIQYSGANNPIYIVRHKFSDYHTIHELDSERIKLIEDQVQHKILYELKPDRMPAAIYLRMEQFTYIEFQLQSGDMLYMFTDGFPDQFGGPYDKKYYYKRFKKFLMSISHLPADEQINLLEKEFENWRGNNPQIDDVTILGLRV